MLFALRAGMVPVSTLSAQLNTPYKPLRYGQRPLAAKMLTGAMEFLDANKMRELIITDALLMVIPRTTIDGLFREKAARWDAIREVLMREVLTTAAMVFVMPLIGNGVSKVYDRSPAINKRGIFTGAWINEHVLNRAMQHYDDVLAEMVKAGGADALQPEKVRQAIIGHLLNDLETGDQTLLNGLKYALKDLPADVVKQVEPNKASAMTALTKTFDINANKPTKGIAPVDEAVQQRLLQSIKHNGTDNVAKANNFTLRLRENVKDLNHGKAWMADVDAVLSKYQFGDKLSFSVKGNGRKVMSRQEVMTSLRHFVQQIVDRSLVETRRKDGLVSANKLRAVADELASHTHGAKNWITWLPFIAALAFGRAVPTIINHITNLLHGGKGYFPGDVALMEAVTALPKKTLTTKLLNSQKNNQAFAGFTAGGYNRG
jgi:hypothetical protein